MKITLRTQCLGDWLKTERKYKGIVHLIFYDLVFFVNNDYPKNLMEVVDTK